MAAASTSGGNRLLSTAPAPFNIDLLADIVICTSDSVEFHLVKAILMVASPFFRDMFSLAQPVKENVSAELERIPISETKSTFEPLMRLCYPVDDPVIDDIILLESVLEAAMKYQMQEATKILKTALRGFVAQKPLLVYAVACKLDLEVEARLAADQWKSAHGLKDVQGGRFISSISGGSYVPEMATITAGAYYRLLRHLRGETIETFVVSASKPPSTTDRSSLVEQTFRRSTAGADTVLLSVEGTRFPVHSAVLRVAGAEALLSSPPNDSTTDIPEIQIDLSASTLDALLEHCYPFSSLKSATLAQSCAILDATLKYDVVEAATAAKKLIMGSVEKQPMSVYFIARMRGWADEAEEAARHVIAQGLTQTYAPEMEEAMASGYHRLFDFQHRYCDVVRSVVAEIVPNCGTQWQTVAAVGRKELPVDISAPLVEKVISGGITLVTSLRANINRSASYNNCSGCGVYTSSGRCISCNLRASDPLDFEKFQVSSLYNTSEKLSLKLKEELAKVKLTY